MTCGELIIKLTEAKERSGENAPLVYIWDVETEEYQLITSVVWHPHMKWIELHAD